MYPHALIVGRVVERDAKAHERLARAKLDVRLDVDDVVGRPCVRPPDDERRAHRAALEPLDAHGIRSVDEHVVCRRRVVVGVADIEASDDPADTFELADAQRPVVCDLHTQQPVLEHTAVELDRRTAELAPLGGSHARPAERRRGDARDEPSARARPEHDLPALVLLGLRRDEDRGAQRDEVDRGRVLDRVELEDHPRPRLDREGVQPVAEELAPVQASLHELGDLASLQLDAVQLRHVPRELLRGEARAVGRLEREPVPLHGHGKLELDDVVARVRRRVRHDCRATRRCGTCRLERLDGEVATQLLGLRETHEDLRGDCVGRAAADRVVRRVLDHPSPREPEELALATRRRAERRAARRIARATARHALRPL